MHSRIAFNFHGSFKLGELCGWGVRCAQGMRWAGTCCGRLGLGWRGPDARLRIHPQGERELPGQWLTRLQVENGVEGAERRLRGIGEVIAALSRRDGGQDECGALGLGGGEYLQV